MSPLKLFRLPCYAKFVTRRKEFMNSFPRNNALVDRIPTNGCCLFYNKVVIEMDKDENQKCLKHTSTM